MTLGRHLDNDVLLAGEDVLDYHLRLEMTDRGPRVLPLGDASLRVNGRDLARPVGLKPGDTLEVGQTTLALEVELQGPPEADVWHLHGGNAAPTPLAGACGVGREPDNQVRLDDDHISRHHARLINHDGLIWLQDLESSNGTYVNGERLEGACRLLHGDEVRFDAHRFQLVGSGADLTPVRQHDGAPQPQPLKAVSVRDDNADTTEFTAVEEHAPAAVDLPPGSEPGAFLLGASEPVTGMTFRTRMGRTLIGRDESCDVVIRDRTVSARHAELMVRAEGVTVTNLMATNGTRVNGSEVQSARLHDGDVLRFGRVSLVFKDVPAGAGGRPWLRRAQILLVTGSVLLTLGLLYLLL